MLQATHKWALTGSPFVNEPDDIASLLAFLRVQPLCDKAIFKEKVVVSDPLAAHSRSTVVVLRER